MELITNSYEEAMLRKLHNHISTSCTASRVSAERSGRPLRRYLRGPDGAVAVAFQLHVRRHTGDMVDQTKIGSGQKMPLRFRTKPQLRKWKDAGASPLVDVLLGFGGRLQVWSSRTSCWLVGRYRAVSIVAPATMLCTISTVGSV